MHKSITPAKAPSKEKKRLWLWLLLAILLVAAVILSVCLSVSAARRVLTFHGIRIDRDLYAYWQARYRYEYLTVYASSGASDTDAFWNAVQDSATGVTYGEDCETLTQNMVLRIITAAYLFDTSGETLSTAERQDMENSFEDLLTYRFGGNKDTFREQAEVYGFSLSDVKKAYVYEYKAALLPSHVSLSDEQIAAYYQTHYTRVQWLYLPANTPEETLINLRGQLADATDADARISLFSSFVSDSAYNRNPAADSFPDGYYFAPGSAYLESFREEFPRVYLHTDGSLLPDAAFSLSETGDYTEVSSPDGTWFLMRYALRLDSLSDDTYLETMFSDLPDLALADYFPTWLDSYAPDARWKLRNARTWIPQGVGSNLYLFF